MSWVKWCPEIVLHNSGNEKEWVRRLKTREEEGGWRRLEGTGGVWKLDSIFTCTEECLPFGKREMNGVGRTRSPSLSLSWLDVLHFWMRGPYSSPLCFSILGSLKSINNVRCAPLMSEKKRKKEGLCRWEAARVTETASKPAPRQLGTKQPGHSHPSRPPAPHCSLIFLSSASHGNDSPHLQKASSELHFCKSDTLINEDLRLPPPLTLSLSLCSFRGLLARNWK